MGKSRKNIPKSIKELVLKEYSHRCAICGGNRPQLHHIDENPNNNDQLNLIPLCPNCHLTDLHDPTKPVDPEKLSLFRKYKDPHILSPKFQPLFNRLQFLYTVDENSNAIQLDSKAEELVEFIDEMAMGTFYSKKVAKLARMRHLKWPILIDDEESIRKAAEHFIEDQRKYLEKLIKNRDAIDSLIVEVLRYQNWQT